jgi:CubicO group peptidase (beta-lactamase class C family)
MRHVRPRPRPGWIASSLLALCLAAAPSVVAQTAPPPGLDAYVERAMRAWHVPGVAIAIVVNDSVVLAKGYGVRELGKPDPVDAHTLFAIGSNTKLFTATAIGMMVDAGRMAWDEHATTYLPGFQLYDPWVTREITIRDLLSHRSGLGRRGDNLWYGSPYDRDEVLRRIRYLRPNTSFRSAYGYQNIMFLAAGQALAAAAGMRWDDVIAQRIFAPLGMRESNTSVEALRGERDVATPHLILPTGVRAVPWRNIDNVAPAGSINSSVSDMAQWLRLLLGNGTYAGRQLVRAPTLAEIESPQTIVPSRPDTLFPSTHFTMYGLGIGMRDYLGRKVLAHSGGIDGMLSEVRVVPEARLGFVILTNAEGHMLGPALAMRIIDAYLGAAPRDWSAVYLAMFQRARAQEDSAEKALAAARVPGTRPSLPLERYVGTYADTMYGTATVALERGALVVRYGPAFTGDLEHWHYDTFRVRWRDPRAETGFVTFELGAAGTVTHMNVDGLADFRFTPASTTKPTAASRDE